ncbi:MAG: hypothetical protein KGY99_04400 [Phycisphaerae bacterium]|nr:hypothetical protein [Phycisphaerae bacterium]
MGAIRESQKQGRDGVVTVDDVQYALMGMQRGTRRRRSLLWTLVGQVGSALLAVAVTCTVTMLTTSYFRAAHAALSVAMGVVGVAMIAISWSRS